MQAKKIFLVLLLVVGAIAALTSAGCGAQASADQLNQETYSKIEKGMTAAQVTAHRRRAFPQRTKEHGRRPRHV